MDEAIEVSAIEVKDDAVTEEELQNLTDKIAYCYTEDQELLTMVPKDILERLDWIDEEAKKDLLFLVDYDCKTITLKIDDF
jgi:hypothetical protein